jgi:serine/threonine protein kinase
VAGARPSCNNGDVGNTPSESSTPSVLDVHFTSMPDMDDASPALTANEGLLEDGPDSSKVDSGLGKWKGSVPPPADNDELVGTTLSNTYEVRRILGEGGMGRVYEAQHTRIQSKRFAVKALHPEFARRSDVLARFQREVEAAASINSPHVVGVYDVDQTEDGRPFLVSELLEGKELGDYLDNSGQVPIVFAVNVLRQICRALIAAHERGVVHRDMKPENVFLSGDVQAPLVKVLDFGISRLDGQQGNTLTKTGFIMGTPSYMAPEQAKGLRVDHRADVYSVGAILYQMVTGTIPFDRNDATATLAAVLTEEPQPPRSLNPELPEHFEMIIQRAMAKDPDDRFGSMLELDLALAPYDEGDPIVDEPSRSLRIRPLQGSMIDASAEAREAASARPTLVLFGTVMLVGLGLGLVSAIAALLRLSKDGASPVISGTEALIIGVVLAAAISTPMVLLLRHVAKAIWPNTAKVLELLHRLRPPVIAALSVYGLSAIFLRAAETVMLRTPTGTSWPGWDLLLPMFAIGTGAAVFLGRGPNSSKPRVLDRMGTVPAAAIAALCGFGLLGGAMGLRSGASTTESTAGGVTTATSEVEPTASAEETSPGAVVPSSTAPPMTSKASIAQWNKVGRFIKLGATKDAVAGVGPLLALDPNAPSDKDVRSGLVKLTVRACLQHGDTCDQMLDLLTGKMAHHGPDILYELLITKGGTSAQKHATRLLTSPDVQKISSRAMLIAYNLRVQPGCDAKRKLFPQALTHGDHRALREMKIIASRRQCQMLKCCLDGDADLQAVIKSVSERLKN